jgi:LacI family transcriptional regulator
MPPNRLVNAGVAHIGHVGVFRTPESMETLDGSLRRIILADVARGEDSPPQTRQATLDLFAAHPEITAVYNVAGGNLGLASALEELGCASDVVVIAEANRITVPPLKNGTIDFVIAQDPRALFDAAASVATGLGNHVGQHVSVDFGIYSRFNIPSFSMSGDPKE